MPWTIEYAETALTQPGKLDKRAARRIVDYMDDRVAPLNDPRSVGRALVGPLGGLWHYRVGSYRVICDLQPVAPRVLVVMIGSRDKVYR